MLTESTEKISRGSGVDREYCKGYLKHKKEKRFLMYMNVVICGSRFITVSGTVPFLFKEVFPIFGQNFFQI